MNGTLLNCVMTKYQNGFMLNCQFIFKKIMLINIRDLHTNVDITQCILS